MKKYLLLFVFISCSMPTEPLPDKIILRLEGYPGLTMGELYIGNGKVSEWDYEERLFFGFTGWVWEREIQWNTDERSHLYYLFMYGVTIYINGIELVQTRTYEVRYGVIDILKVVNN
jgi:hypothetical protein